MGEGARVLRAGVVGAGVFGGYHASKYADHPEVQLVGVYDPDDARAAAQAERWGVQSFSNAAEMFAACDAVTVASPAPTHGALAIAALNAGSHVLVEKPLAITVEEASAVAETAERAQRIVQVGHQERFVFAAMGVLGAPERPRLIRAKRMTPFSERGADVSVSLDLMTHDIDLARLLAERAPVARIASDIVAERADYPDHVSARIEFENGVTAELEASRLASERERTMRLEYDSGVVEIDFLAKTFTNTTPHALNADFASAPQARDSLAASVSAFIDAVKGRADAAIPAQDGVEAVRVALAADAAVVTA